MIIKKNVYLEVIQEYRDNKISLSQLARFFDFTEREDINKSLRQDIISLWKHLDVMLGIGKEDKTVIIDHILPQLEHLAKKL